MTGGQDRSRVEVDLSDGGRWTSLRLLGREWLWSGPGRHSGPRSSLASYVDVGGLDECCPTVRGVPDHGVLWRLPWSNSGNSTHKVRTKEFALERRLTSPAPEESEGRIVADYQLSATPGFRFVWAAHALLDCRIGAEIEAPADARCRLYPEAAELIDRPWPTGSPWIEGNWPTPAGLDMSKLGPNDGTAVGAVLIDCPAITVHDGSSALSLELSCPRQPVSTAIWRNLGGYPDGAPYRSLGVEPMLGRVFDLAEAGPGDAATTPAQGRLSWRMTISASDRSGN